MKNNLFSLPYWRIIWLSKTFDDNGHDKKICNNQPLHFSLGITLKQNTGVQVYTPNGVSVKMPTKKPKGK